MSIIKSNSARGAFKGVAEWISRHTEIDDLTDQDIVLKDDGYDLSPHRTGEYSWNAKRLYFRQIFIDKDSKHAITDSYDLRVPDCLSQDFWNRIDSITIGFKEAYNVYLNETAMFNPESLMTFPHMENLKKITCTAPLQTDITDFVVRVCKGAQHIGAHKSVDILLGERDDMKLEVYNSLIANYLHIISIGDVKHITIHSNYFVHHKASGYISQGRIQSFKVVGEPDDEDPNRVKLCNFDLDYVEVPNTFGLDLDNCRVGNIDDILNRDRSRTAIDERTLIKSGKGVDPVTSTAIDMFGNFILPGDIVAYGDKGRAIGFTEVIRVEGEELDVKDTFGDMINYYEYTNRAVWRGTLTTKLQDRYCWKVSREFLKQCDRNGFNKSIYKTSKQ